MNKKSLITTITGTNNEINNLEDKKKQLNSYKIEINLRKKDLSKTLNFLQKSLGLHCIGKNKTGSIKYMAIENMLEIIPVNIDHILSEIKEKHDYIDKLIIEYLTSTDEGFSKFMEIYNEIILVFDFMSKINEEIEEAIDSVDSAQSNETLDLLTDSKFISLMSYSSNNSAQSEINDVEELLPKLNEHIEKIKLIAKEFKDNDIEINISNIEGFDLVLDFCLDGGFDFSSIMSLSALSSASEDLEEIEGTIKKLLKSVSEVKNKTEMVKDEMISKFKKEIDI